LKVRHEVRANLPDDSSASSENHAIQESNPTLRQKIIDILTSPPGISSSHQRLIAKLHRPEKMLGVTATYMGQTLKTFRSYAANYKKKYKDLTVCRASFRRLRVGEWLNDEVISFYLALLKKRQSMLNSSDKTSLTMDIVDTYFYQYLSGSDFREGGEYNYQSVRRRFNFFFSRNIFELDVLFIPINYPNAHWAVVAVYPQRERIYFLDPYGEISGRRELNYIMRFLRDEFEHRNGCPLPHHKWELKGGQIAIEALGGVGEIQGDGVSCGVHICSFVDMLSLEYPLVIDQHNIDEYRLLMTLSVLKLEAPTWDVDGGTGEMEEDEEDVV